MHQEVKQENDPSSPSNVVPASSNKRNISEISVLEQELQKNVEELCSKKLKTGIEQYDLICDIEKLKSSTYDEINRIFVAERVLDDEDISYIKLKGRHLYNAISAYETNIQSGGTKETAKGKMIYDLMQYEKVTNGDVAKSIANWLCSTYIDMDQFPIFKQILEYPIHSTQLVDNFRKIAMKYPKEFAELKSIEYWAEIGFQDRLNYPEEIRKFMASLFVVQMNSFVHLCKNFEKVEDVERYRKEFDRILQMQYGEDFKIEDIEFDDRLKKYVMRSISLAEINNSSKSKEFANDFYNPNFTIPLPIYNEQVFIQFLGLVDHTDFIINKDLEERVAHALQSNANAYFTIMLGPSGTGKTHDLLKLGCKYPCLYFNGTFIPTLPNCIIDETKMDGGIVYEPGFEDKSIAALINFCKSWFQEWNISNSNEAHLVKNFMIEYLTEVLILSRIIYYEKLNEFFLQTAQRNIYCSEYLYMQINGNNQFTHFIFDKLVKAKIAPNSIERLIKEKCQTLKMPLFIVMDECYILGKDNIGISTISYNGKDKRSLLTPVAKALAKHAQVLLFCGTNANIVTRQILISSIGKQFEKEFVFTPKFAEDWKQVGKWIGDLIRIEESVLESYSDYLKGLRIRAVMTIVKEACSAEMNKDKQISERERLSIAIQRSIDLTVRSIVATFVKEFESYNKDEAKQKAILDLSISFILQFSRNGKFTMKKSNVPGNLDLVYLSLCYLKDGIYYSEETIALKAMVQFITKVQHFNTLLNVFACQNIGMPASSLGFVLEDFIGLLLLDKGKVQTLLSLIPPNLHPTLQQSTKQLLSNSCLYISSIESNLEKKPYKIFVQQCLQNATMMRLNYMVGPDFLLKHRSYTLSIALKSSQDTIAKNEKVKNSYTVDVHNLFHSELYLIKKIAFELGIAKDMSYNNADYSTELLLLDKIILQLQEERNQQEKVVENTCRNILKRAKRSTEDLETKLTVWKQMLRNDEEYYRNNIASCFQQVQLRIQIEIDNSVQNSTIEESPTDNIVTVIICKHDLHSLFDLDVCDSVKHFLSLFSK